MAALSIRFNPDQAQVLAQASAPELVFPYHIFTPELNRETVFGGVPVQGWH